MGRKAMSQDRPQDRMAEKRVVYEVPGMGSVIRQTDRVFGSRDGDALTYDLYIPPDVQQGALLPAVILAAGYPDPGFQKVVGCRFKEMGSTVSWARLIAASGLAAIAYSNREPAPDVHTLLRYLGSEGASVGLDGSRLGVWASSGNGPLALSFLRGGDIPLRCAALCYPYTLDVPGSASVAGAAARFGFANPCAGTSIVELRRDVPLFVARAGKDEMPGLNEALDRFVLAALERDLPLTLVSYASAPHAFDLFRDTAESREIVRQILAFLRFHLDGGDERAG
jgi:hypothetical protein